MSVYQHRQTPKVGESRLARGAPRTITQDGRCASRHIEAGMGTGDEIFSGEELLLGMFEHQSIVFQGRGDLFTVLQKFDRPVKEPLEFVAVDQAGKIGVVRCREDEHVAELTKTIVNRVSPAKAREWSTYACAVPKMLVIINRSGTLSNAVVLRMAA